ncbi:major facilitator superfamily transporter [Colletotrichum cuscutae]|uniref:Major facilitator superfamily transporter n=1 Tax=Colletotrichum cuscutae TaxID=1209917 RepID=A0AAI9VG96_9PEZI|nr:major facilitator superfamily transporter [Colletotrichum cuscutae]
MLSSVTLAIEHGAYIWKRVAADVRVMSTKSVKNKPAARHLHLRFWEVACERNLVIKPFSFLTEQFTMARDLSCRLEMEGSYPMHKRNLAEEHLRRSPEQDHEYKLDSMHDSTSMTHCPMPWPPDMLASPEKLGGFYQVEIAFGVLLLLEISFLPETFYPRKSISDSVLLDQEWDIVKRTKNLRLWVSLFAPTAASSRVKEADVYDGHPLHEAFIPYIFFQYCPLSSGIYPGTQTQGLLWLGLNLGTGTIEMVFSSRILDKLASQLARSKTDIIAPAMYLWLAYPAALLGAGGCILRGRFVHLIQMGNVTVLEVISLYGFLYNVRRSFSYSILCGL